MIFLISFFKKIKLYLYELRKRIRRYYYTQVGIKRISNYETIPYINNKCIFNNNIILGSNCHFNGMEVGGAGKVTIGDNFHSGPFCMMITQNHNIHGEELPYDSSYILKDIVIGDNVWIGSRVIILGGVSIGEGAVIQAGSVVVSDIPALSIAGGHPAKVFSHRDSEHYYKLKKEKKFS
ncbi:acyltransferase [Aliivibrio fischeri]|uniref:acyltransferase n=1 Tax=Aliivibrio fischeri TaxID=668 RepID=UPI0012D8594E|nr:acyltransferase [Aliivibrio fischeri]MUI52481.1 acyltransferase [Aliivibrio fischeri]